MFVAGNQASRIAGCAGVLGHIFLVRHHNDRLPCRESSANSVMISAPVLLSRLPVGSSARRMEGRFH